MNSSGMSNGAASVWDTPTNPFCPFSSLWRCSVADVVHVALIVVSLVALALIAGWQTAVMCLGVGLVFMLVNMALLSRVS